MYPLNSFPDPVQNEVPHWISEVMADQIKYCFFCFLLLLWESERTRESTLCWYSDYLKKKKKNFHLEAFLLTLSAAVFVSVYKDWCLWARTKLNMSAPAGCRSCFVWVCAQAEVCPSIPFYCLAKTPFAYSLLFCEISTVCTILIPKNKGFLCLRWVSGGLVVPTFFYVYHVPCMCVSMQL